MEGRSKIIPPMPRLSEQRFLWCLALAALCAVWAESFHAGRHFELSYDNYQQIAAAQNWVDGHGLVLRHFDAASPHAVSGMEMSQWPPGFSWLMSIPLFLGGDPVAMVRLLHWAAALLYLAGWFGWLVALRPSLGDGPVLAGAVFGILGLTPVQYLPTGDRLALACFLPATWLLYRLATAAARRPWMEACLAGALLLSTMLLRYAYWPLAVLAPVVALGISPHRRKLPRWLFWSWPVLGAGLALALLWITGGIHQQGPDGRLHWENLLHFRPFPAHAFGFHRAIRSLFLTVGATSEAYSPSLWILAAAISAGWSFVTFRGVREKGDDRVFHGLGLLCVAGMTVILAAISLGLEAAVRRGSIVTPVNESRYFAPALPFLALGCLFLLKRRGWVRAVSASVLGLSLAVGTVGRYRLMLPTVDEAEVVAFRSIRGQVREYRRRGYEVFWTNNGNPRRHYQAVASGGIPLDWGLAGHRALKEQRAVVYNSRTHKLSIP